MADTIGDIADGNDHEEEITLEMIRAVEMADPIGDNADGDDHEEEIALEMMQMIHFHPINAVLNNTPYANRFINEYIERAQPKGSSSQGVSCGILVTINGTPIHYVIPDEPWVEAPWGDMPECLLWLARNAHNPDFTFFGDRESQMREWGDDGVISGFKPEYFIRHALYRTDNSLEAGAQGSTNPRNKKAPHGWGTYLVNMREAAVLGQISQDSNPTRPSFRVDKWLRKLDEWLEGPMSVCHNDLLKHQWVPGGYVQRYPDWPYSAGKGPHFWRTRPSPLDALLVAHRMAERYGGSTKFAQIYDPLREYMRAQAIEPPPEADLNRHLPEQDRHGGVVPVEDWQMDEVTEKLFAFDNMYMPRLRKPVPPEPMDVPLVVVQIELCDPVFLETNAEKMLDFYGPRALLKRALQRINHRQMCAKARAIADTDWYEHLIHMAREQDWPQIF